MSDQDLMRTITAAEAQRTLGIPSGTIRGWASAGKLYACAIGQDGQRWYKLGEVLELAATTKRRTRHERPMRRSFTHVAEAI